MPTTGRKNASVIFGTEDCGVVLYIPTDTSSRVALYTFRVDDDGPPLNWRERVEFCWHVVKSGYTWTGEHVEVEMREAQKMGEWLREKAWDWERR